MKHLYLAPAILALVTGVAYADEATLEFSEADTDKDGILNTDEARQAFPGLVVVDVNNDGMFNKEEAERALPGLTLTRDTDQESADAVIGESDYGMIVEAIEAQQEDQS